MIVSELREYNLFAVESSRSDKASSAIARSLPYGQSFDVGTDRQHKMDDIFRKSGAIGRQRYGKFDLGVMAVLAQHLESMDAALVLRNIGR